jgi:hypothetical protein
MLSYYLDEDCAEVALIESLRVRGIEVTAPLEVGLQGREDVLQLEWCAQNAYTLVTHNVGDFVRLHTAFLAKGRRHSGIILMRQQTLGLGEKLRRLIRIAGRFSPEQMENRVEFLSNWTV